MSGALGRPAREVEPAQQQAPRLQRDKGIVVLPVQVRSRVEVVVEAVAEMVAVAVVARKTAGAGD